MAALVQERSLVHRLAAVLMSLSIGVGLAACGDDDESATGTTEPAAVETTPAETTAADAATTPALGDEPVTVEATITAIEQVGGSDDPAAMDSGFSVLTAEQTDGPTYRVLVPPDVTLDSVAQQVFHNPECAGKVLADLEIVAAPDHEENGDAILVSARIDTESCLTGG
jgi:hypothetical protein